MQNLKLSKKSWVPLLTFGPRDFSRLLPGQIICPRVPPYNQSHALTEQAQSTQAFVEGTVCCLCVCVYIIALNLESSTLA